MALLDRPPEDRPYRERVMSKHASKLSAKSVQRPVQQKRPEESHVPHPPPHPPKHPPKPPSSRHNKQLQPAFIHTNDSIKDATASSHGDAGASPKDGEDGEAADVVAPQRGSHHVDLDLMTEARAKGLPPKPKRVQSANPRLRCRPSGAGGDEPASHGDKPQVRRRPVSAKAAVYTADDSNVALQNTQPHPPPDVSPVPDMEPWVFGYRSGSYVSSTEPGHDVPDTIPNRCFDRCVDKELRSVVNTGRWARPRGARGGTSDTRIVGMTVSSRTDLKLEDISASVPATLRPLLPWFTPDIPKEWTGLDPSQCLVFLPSLLRMPDPWSLPCVPAPMAPSDPLPHHGRVIPNDEKPPTLVRNYAHPWTKVPVEEWVCRHGGSRGKDSQIQIYSQDGKLLHQGRTGRRTADTVRREITELEDLMKGIGTADGTSIIVRYQADINKLQEMLGQIMGRVEEIERREAEKNKVPEPSDYSGVRAILENHAEVIKAIEARHRECLQELALLENDIETDTECSLEDAPQNLSC